MSSPERTPGTAPVSPEAAVSGEALRAAMRHVPAAVTVVTVGGEEPRGITIASFSSVSLDPPLISFNVQRAARMYPLLERADRYAVHVLRADQVALSDRFAHPGLAGAEQFDGVPHLVGPGGLPLLQDVLAVFECRPWAIYDAGDHALFVGEVTAVAAADGGDPVLYFQRSYRTVGDLIAGRS